MEDDEFEKYLERIEEIFNKWGEYADLNPCSLKRKLNCFGKVKLKEILEEIESDAFKRGVSKLLEIPKDIEVELIKLKEAKIQG